MFPHKKGLGVQLLHGAPGPALPLFQYDAEEPWVFARTRDGGVELHCAKDSLTEVTGAQVTPRERDFDRKTVKENGFDASVADLPGEVLRTFELEERNTLESHPLVYDPSESALMDSGTLAQNKSPSPVECCACVTGSAKSILSVQVLHRPYREKVDLKSDGTKGYVKPYTLGFGASIPFPSPIQQVEVAKNSSSSFATQRHILVRTLRECTLIRVSIYKDYMKLEKKCSLAIDKFGEEFAHLTFNPYNTRIFGVVGVKGKWAIVQANPGKTKLRMTFLGVTFDATDFSRFKRIAWTADEQKILVMGRKYLKVIDVLSGKSKDVISMKSWSQIRDYKKWTSDDRYSFLLTSKELIVSDTQRGLTRVLSWKHNWDANDPSLMMSVSETDDIQFVFLYSLMSPIVMVFEFKMEDGMAKSLRDPYILDVAIDPKTRGLLLYPCSIDDEDGNDDEEEEDSQMDDVWNEVLGEYAEAHEGKWFTLIQMTTDLALKTMLMGTEDCTMIRDDEDESEDEKDLRQEPVLPKLNAGYRVNLIKRSTKMTARLSKKADGLISELFDEDEDQKKDQGQEQQEIDDSQVFQDYASRFNIVKSDDTKAMSLLKLTTPIDKFEPFEEFDNMLVQLQEHCESQGMDYLPFKQYAQSVCGVECDSLSEFSSKLRQLWGDDDISKEAVRDVGLAMSVIYDKSVEDRKLEKSLESIPPRWKKITDCWYDEFLDSDDEYAKSQRSGTDTEAPVVLEPTIKVTQPQNSQAGSSSQMASQSIMKPSQRMSQKMASQRMSQSQGPSQKKKKRRVKGFA